MENLHISTITGIGSYSCDFDLKEIYDTLIIDKNIKLIKYKDFKSRGDLNLIKKKDKTAFYNQVTILFNYINKIVNVKIFNNGKIQMTGLKNTDACVEILEILRKKIVESKILSNLDNIVVTSSEIVLINSDCKMGYKINPDILYRIILNEGIFVTYEPCIYPGVNIKYYIKGNEELCGKCNCNNLCNGKGKNGDCKKVTIAVFNSGNIIITGARKTEQLLECYHFITNTINKNRSELEQKSE